MRGIESRLRKLEEKQRGPERVYVILPQFDNDEEGNTMVSICQTSERITMQEFEQRGLDDGAPLIEVFTGE